MRGYAATTIEAISDLSDTPPATVYRLFSSKLGILRALLDVSAVGDDEAVAMGDRPRVRALLEDPDPRNQVLGFAGLARDVMSRLAPVHRILVSAAGSDSEAAELARRAQAPAARGTGTDCPFPRPGRCPAAQSCASETPRTSSMPSCRPRFTCYLSPTGGGLLSATRIGSAGRSSRNSSPRQRLTIDANPQLGGLGYVQCRHHENHLTSLSRHPGSAVEPSPNIEKVRRPKFAAYGSIRT